MKPSSNWNRILAPYAFPSKAASVAQLTMTLAIFAALVIGAHLAHAIHWSLGLPFSVAAGFSVVKLFIIQHDCGHRSFFRSPQTCDRVGRFLSLFTFTPYGFWRRDHDVHHATSGHLDKRGTGDIHTKTVAEFLSLSEIERFKYRLYRHPATLFAFGPTWQFLLRYRIPMGISPKQRAKATASVMMHNAALATFFGTLCLILGWTSVVAVWFPSVVTAATVGVWLFFVQHNFQETYWERHFAWNFADASLKGCSYYRLPKILHWATGNIGYHHIHHLSSRIPNYRLPKAFAEIPELRTSPSLSVRESLRCARLSLWCEDRRRMISFADLRQSRDSQPCVPLPA